MRGRGKSLAGLVEKVDQPALDVQRRQRLLQGRVQDQAQVEGLPHRGRNGIECRQFPVAALQRIFKSLLPGYHNATP